MELNKKQLLIAGAIVIVFMIILYAIGYSVGSKNLKDEAVIAATNEKLNLDEDYKTKQNELESLNSQIAEKNSELQDVSTNLDTAKNELKVSQDKLDTLADYDTKVQALNDEVATLTANRDSLKGEVESLTANRDSLQSELDSLRGEIVKASGEPIKLSAGVYYAGTDIKTGRYRVSNGSSNFFVYDSKGRSTVNIILGNKNDGLWVTDYTFDLRSGYTIETSNTCTLTPVE